MRSVLSLCVWMFVCCVVYGEEDYQQWSDQSYLDEPHVFSCNESKIPGKPIYVNIGDRLEWSRHHGGENHVIETDGTFELRREQDIDNMELVVRKVTDDLSGIYFCDVFNSSGGHVGRVVRGLNLGYHKYQDDIDKYRDNIITGVICGACVFVLIVGFCIIDTFRYLTDEQMQKRRERKEERLRKRRELKNGEFNQALDMTGEQNSKNSYSPNGRSQTEVNTHL